MNNRVPRPHVPSGTRRAVGKLGIWAWTVALAAMAPAALADPARLQAYGRHLAQECTSCHRLDGVDNGIPSIVGWDVAGFAETLRYYTDGSRTNPAMASVAGSLDAEQVAALAAYFASLPKPKMKTGSDRASTR